MNLLCNPTRQRLRLIVAGWLIIWAGGLVALGQASGEVRLVEAQGVVEISPAGANRWVLTQTNQTLHGGDRLRTGINSRAALRWSDQSVVPLGPQTELEVAGQTPGEEPTIRLIRGVLSFFHRGQPGHIQIITRGATAGIDGTEFVLEAQGTDPGGPVTLSVIDGEVRMTNGAVAATLTNGEQATAMAGTAPIKSRGFIANNIIQWCFYYPAVLDLNDLQLSAAETNVLAPSLKAYRAGNVVEALARLPARGNPASDDTRIYEAAVVLSTGDVNQAQVVLDGLTGGTATSRIERLARALKWLIAAVKRQSVRANAQLELPSEFLAASYYEQSRGNGEQSLTTALDLARRAADHSPRFAFAWERVAELEFGFGRIEKAQAALAKGVALAPENAQAVALQGFIEAAQNRTHQAEMTFHRAIDLDNALGNAWLGRGLCRIREGNARSGRGDLLIAAALEPQRALLRSYLGKAFADMGDDTHADHELTLARGLDSSDPTAWLYSALLAQQQNRINPAISDLQRAQTNNDNRGIFRSRLLLDEDRAVESANLASVYRDAGLSDISLQEAARAAAFDDTSSAAHLFLSDSYNDLRDPTRFNLRYETVWFNELLLANLLAPVGAGRLSQEVSQQEYSRLFEADGLHLSSFTDVRSDGMFHEGASQFGTFGDTSWSLDLDYQHNNGIRVNNDLDDIEWYSTIKQQVTPRDAALLLVKYEDYHSGDNFQYYNQNSARPNYRFDESQAPILFAGWHHQWGPGMHTLVLAGHADNEQHFSDAQAPELLLSESPAGAINGSDTSETFNVAYHNRAEIYSGEFNQITEWSRVRAVLGTRYQTGTFATDDELTYSPATIPALFNIPAATGAANDHFDRATGYGYLTVEPLDNLRLTAGLTYDTETFPQNFRQPPISSGQDSRSQLGPKAALVWSPFSQVTLRGIYAQSLGGVSLDESIRLEPTQLAGFPQAFRSLISESVVGSLSAPKYDITGLALDFKLEPGIYAGIIAEQLKCNVRQDLGTFLLQNGNTPAITGSTPERLDYTERDLGVNLNKLIGNDVVVGASYQLISADLRETLPGVPLALLPTAAQKLDATLHEATAYLVFNHPSGFFARAETQWYSQANAGYTPAEPGDDFSQHNIYAGWRFDHRHAELMLGLLNLAGRDYRLNPLTVYSELPRGRVFEARLKFEF